jgi:hypothetical protein
MPWHYAAARRARPGPARVHAILHALSDPLGHGYIGLSWKASLPIHDYPTYFYYYVLCILTTWFALRVSRACPAQKVHCSLVCV